MTETTTLLTRVGDRPITYAGPRRGTCYNQITLTKHAPTDCAYIDDTLLMVRYSTNRATALTAETLAHAALSMAAHCPAMRADLIARLAAQDAAEVEVAR